MPISAAISKFLRAHSDPSTSVDLKALPLNEPWVPYVCIHMNITPFGMSKSWAEDQIISAMRSGTADMHSVSDLNNNVIITHLVKYYSKSIAFNCIIQNPCSAALKYISTHVAKYARVYSSLYWVCLSRNANPAVLKIFIDNIDNIENDGISDNPAPWVKDLLIAHPRLIKKSLSKHPKPWVRHVFRIHPKKISSDIHRNCALWVPAFKIAFAEFIPLI